jgi:hypothetical protein
MPFPILWLIGGALAGGALVAAAVERENQLALNGPSGSRMPNEPDRKRAEEVARRIIQIVLRYEHCAHYEDEDFLSDHATVNREDILRRRDAILAAHEELIRDTDVVRGLRKQSPETYERACWEMKALAIAERLSVGPRADFRPVRRTPPSPPKDDPKVTEVVIDVTATDEAPRRDPPRQRSEAQRAAEAIRARADVEFAKLRATIAVEEKVRAILKKMNLSDDDIERYIAAFMMNLAGSGKESGNGFDRY